MHSSQDSAAAKLSHVSIISCGALTRSADKAALPANGLLADPHIGMTLQKKPAGTPHARNIGVIKTKLPFMLLHGLQWKTGCFCGARAMYMDTPPLAPLLHASTCCLTATLVLLWLTCGRGHPSGCLTSNLRRGVSRRRTMR